MPMRNQHLGVILATLLIFPQPLWAGPILLSGDDSDDHINPCTVFLPVFQSVLDNVTNGGSGILVLGVANENSPTTTAGNFIFLSGASQGWAECVSPAQTVTFKSGTNIDTVSFTGYAIIYLPSDIGDVGGGINASDNTRVVNRKS